MVTGNNPRQREFFDRAAATWDRDVQHDRGKISRISNMLDIERGSRVLDVGTGTGVMLPLLLEGVGPEGQVVGIDYSGNMLELARGKFPPDDFPNLMLVHGDATTMELRGMDRVLCYSVFPHFVDQGAALTNLVRGLNPGGRLMVAHSNSRDHINGVHMEAGREVANDLLPPMAEMIQLFEATGLQVQLTIDDGEYFIIMGGSQGSREIHGDR
jgi:demethylmenaquinone methyltransferase/2-methoxy-6-polyprenyl-1,4-benzoquinol methylase